MTIPVWKKGMGLQEINKVRICRGGRWPEKHLISLMSAYSRSPYLGDHLNFMERIFSPEFELLIDLNMTIIRYLMKELRINTRVVLQSGLEKKARGTPLLIGLCRDLGADLFLAQGQARKYLDTGLFRDAGIGLRFFRQPSIVYPQLWGDFIPNLSALDLLFNCGPKAGDILAGSRRGS